MYNNDILRSAAELAVVVNRAFSPEVQRALRAARAAVELARVTMLDLSNPEQIANLNPGSQQAAMVTTIARTANSRAKQAIAYYNLALNATNPENAGYFADAAERITEILTAELRDITQIVPFLY